MLCLVCAVTHLVKQNSLLIKSLQNLDKENYAHIPTERWAQMFDKFQLLPADYFQNKQLSNDFGNKQFWSRKKTYLM